MRMMSLIKRLINKCDVLFHFVFFVLSYFINNDAESENMSENLSETAAPRFEIEMLLVSKKRQKKAG